MKLKPAEGRNVRDPKTKRHLPPEGKDVVESSYWLRRLACGDVVVVQPTQIPDSSPNQE